MPKKGESSDGLKERLEAACEDLWWSSEADYPVKVVWQPQIEKQDEPIGRWVASLHPEEAMEKIDVNDLFEQATAPKSWHSKEDKVQLNRTRQLQDLLTSKLSHLQVYRCGEVEISMYVLGYSDSDVLSGIQTILVET